MGLLPSDLGDVQAELRSGVYLLPWYYSTLQVRRFMALIGALRKDLRYLVEVPAGAEMPAPPTDDAGLVLFAEGEPYDALRARLDALPYRYIFVHHPEHQEQGYGWIERDLKPPVDEVLNRVRGDRQHPLASVHLKFLPVDEAMSLSENVLEVLDLLEEALLLVLAGCATATEQGYREALWMAAGRALALRVASLPVNRTAALEVLLLGDQKQETPRYLHGARALMQVGLSEVSGTAVHLAALAKSIQERTALLALLSELPDSTLSGFSYDRVRDLWPAPELQVTGGLLRTLPPERPRTLRLLGILEDAGLTMEQARKVQVLAAADLEAGVPEQLLAKVAHDPAVEAVRKLWHAGSLLRSGQELALAGTLVEEASRVFAEKAEPSGVATCLKTLGDVARLRGRHSEALSLYKTAQRLFERAEHGLGVALCALGQAQVQDTADAYVQARRLFLEIGDSLGSARCTLLLGLRASRSGNPVEAWLRGRHAREVFRAHGDQVDEAQACLLMGWGNHALGRYEEARYHYEEAAALFKGLGDAQTERECYGYLGLVASRLGDREGEQRYLAMAQ